MRIYVRLFATIAALSIVNLVLALWRHNVDAALGWTVAFLCAGSTAFVEWVERR